MIEGVDVGCGYGLGDGMGRGFVGVEVGCGKVVHGELGHGLTAEVSGFDFGGRRGWCMVDAWVSLMVVDGSHGDRPGVEVC